MSTYPYPPLSTQPSLICSNLAYADCACCSFSKTLESTNLYPHSHQSRTLSIVHGARRLLKATLERRNKACGKSTMQLNLLRNGRGRWIFSSMWYAFSALPSIFLGGGIFVSNFLFAFRELVTTSTNKINYSRRTSSLRRKRLVYQMVASR
jgi:hypothetical protein